MSQLKIIFLISISLFLASCGSTSIAGKKRIPSSISTIEIYGMFRLSSGLTADSNYQFREDFIDHLNKGDFRHGIIPCIDSEAFHNNYGRHAEIKVDEFYIEIYGDSSYDYMMMTVWDHKADDMILNEYPVQVCTQ